MRHQTDKPYEDFNTFDQLFSQAENRDEHWEERAKLEFTREILSEMKKAGVSKSELASRLDVQPGMVTRLLSGRNNFELLTMVRMARALNCRYRSHLEPVNAKTVWFDIWRDRSTPLTNLPPVEEKADDQEFISVETVTCNPLKNEPLPVAA